MKRDNRPAMEQVKSGFKIAGGILSSFAAFVLFAVSYIDIMHPENKHLTAGWILLVATALAMFASVQVWARWFCAIVSYAAVRCTLFIIPALMGFSRVPSGTSLLQLRRFVSWHFVAFASMTGAVSLLLTESALQLQRCSCHWTP